MTRQQLDKLEIGESNPLVLEMIEHERKRLDGIEKANAERAREREATIAYQAKAAAIKEDSGRRIREFTLRVIAIAKELQIDYEEMDEGDGRFYCKPYTWMESECVSPSELIES